MAKYSFEFKKKIVQEYLNGCGGIKHLAKVHGVAHHSSIHRWIVAYDRFGDEGLLRSRQNTNYSFDYKLHVVELYLTTEVSYQQLALSEGINNPALITKWVNDFRIAGSDALKPKKKGRRKELSTTKKNIQDVPENDHVNTDAEYVKQLEEELLKLRIENAYLKELRRLRLEEETLQKKQRESFTASGENLD